ncbi:MAG: beta-galactosidase, partial [Lentisphaeria bacterium]|nr:beta-galactosidase [Lentisphaeria bacterium]
DNLLEFGPVGSKTVNGKSILLDGRTLLKLDFQQRRDPISLKSQSLRHFTKKYYRNFYMTPAIADYRNGLGKASFQKWTRRYNEAMMLAAFQNERIELLERSAYYRNAAAPDFRKKFAELERKQEQALLAFADAFLHGADERRLKTGAEAALTDFERTLARFRRELDAADHADKLIPSEPIYHKWSLQYDPKLRCWTRNGKPEIFISSVSQLRNEPKADFEQTEFILDKVRALGLQPSAVTVGGTTGGAPKNGEYFNVAGFNRGVKTSDTLVRQHHLPPYGLAFMSHGTGNIRMPVPLWWLNQNRKDKDIFFSKPDGTPGDKITPVYRGWPKYPFLSLNFWNGKVQDYISTRFLLYGKAMGRRPDLFGNVMFYLGGEAKIELPSGMAPGHGKSAAAAFQADLKKKYGTIDELNRKWETGYASFEQIVPPSPAAEPSALRYEFQTFVHREYFDRFIRPAKENLEKGFGGKLAIGHDFQDTFSEFDMPAFFDNVSIGLFHSYQVWDRKIYPKYLRSLAEATGTPWGSIEWGPTQGNKTMFDMAETKLHALREISHQIMFGSIAPNMFYEDLNQYPNEWQYGFPLTDSRLGYMPFNYFASFWRLAKDRAVRFGEKAITAKSVTPDAVVLEVDSARRNALPKRSVYTMCKAFSTFMEQQNFLYGFRFEKLVSDGRQKLDGIQVVFVPNGIVMTQALNGKLETYLRNGGTVIAFAPPGVYNEYGKPKSDGLLAKAFPGVKWTHRKYSKWFADGKTALCRQAKLGQGTLYVFDNPNQWDANLTEFQKILKRHIRPSLTCSQNDFQFSYREADGVRYLYVLNYNIDQTREGEFSVPGSVKVTDISLAAPQVLSVTERNGHTSFRTKLAPAALALFKIETVK